MRRHRVERYRVAVLLATVSIAGLSEATAAERSRYGSDRPRYNSDRYRHTPVYKAPAIYKEPIYRESGYTEPAYKPSILPPAAFSWTGFYIGGNLGYGWSKGSGTIELGGASGTFSGTGSAFSGGVQAGYNTQTDAIVWGIEADLQGNGGSGTVNGTAGAATFTGTAQSPIFGTLRGRVGYAVDRTMLYATGGMLFGLATFNGTVSTTGAFSSATTYRAWTFGGGVEQALWSRWSTKLEYLYVATPNTVATPPGTTAISGSAQAHLIRAGLNYRF